MSQSFSKSNDVSTSTQHKRVLVTGAAGIIGSYFAEHSHDLYNLRLMVLEPNEMSKAIAGFGDVVQGNLADLQTLKKHCAGIDTVVHLAGNGNPSAIWETLRDNNIIGTYNLFVAAKAAGCRRVVFASSIHAVSGYPADVQVKANEPVNPGDLYGVSKCFGEAMGRYMAERENLSVIAIRIGAFQSKEAARKEKSINMMDAWVSPSDLIQLIQKSIDAEDLQFAIFHGVSDNRFKRLDISDARELIGYAPQDDSTKENPQLQKLHLKEIVSSHAQENPQKSGIRDDL